MYRTGLVFVTALNKKLSYRRETARQLRVYLHCRSNLSDIALDQTLRYYLVICII